MYLTTWGNGDGHMQTYLNITFIAVPLGWVTLSLSELPMKYPVTMQIMNALKHLIQEGLHGWRCRSVRWTFAPSSSMKFDQVPLKNENKNKRSWNIKFANHSESNNTIITKSKSYLWFIDQPFCKRLTNHETLDVKH